jgi:Fe-S cluster biogenesis protein NfuA
MQAMEAQLLEAVEAIRPALQADGGDMRVVNLDEETGVVEIELMGACGGCPMSTMTLKAGIERILMDRVEGLTEVRVPGLDESGQMFDDNEY